MLEGDDDFMWARASGKKERGSLDSDRSCGQFVESVGVYRLASVCKGCSTPAAIYTGKVIIALK